MRRCRRTAALLVSLLVASCAPSHEPTVNGAPRARFRHALYSTKDFGRTWIAADSGLAESLQVNVLVPWGKRLVVATESRGLFIGTPGQGDWAPRVRAILSVKAGLLVGTDAGIFLVGTGNSTWTQVFTEGQIVSLNKAGRRIVGGGARGTVLSEDEGTTWRWIHKQGAAHNTAIIDDRIVLDLG